MHLKHASIPAALAALLFAAGATHAIDASWTGTSGNWSDAAKWSTNPDIPDQADDIARLGGTSTGVQTTLDQADVVVGQLLNLRNTSWTILKHANAYPLTLQVSSGTAVIHAQSGQTSTVTVNPDVIIASDLIVRSQRQDAQSQNVYINGTLTGSGNVTLDFTGVGNNAAGNITLASLGTAGTLTVQGDNSANGTMTATVGPIGSGVTTLTKTGSCRLILTGVNGYSGATAVNGGILQANLTTSLPGYSTPGVVSVASGAALYLKVGGTGQWTTTDIDTLRANATINAAAHLGFDTTDAAGPFTYSGAITGANFAKLGVNELILTVDSSHTGTTTVSGGGTLTIRTASGLGTTAGGTTVASGATLQMDGTGGAIAVGNEALTLNGTGVGGNGALRNLAGANSWTGKVASGTGGATIQVESGSSLALAGGIGGSGAGTRIATFKGAGSTTIKNITDTAYGLTVTDGTVILEAGNTSTYDRATSVSGGTLLMNGDLDSVGTGVTVGSAGTLGGTGTISRSVTVDGTLAPGVAGIGTLTIDLGSTTGTVAMNSGAKLACDLGTAGKPGDADQLRLLSVVAGDLTLNNNVVNFTNVGGVGPGVYNLMAFYSDGGSTLTDTGKPTSGLAIGTGLEEFPGSSIDYSQTGLIRLVVTGAAGTTVLIR